MLKIYPQNVLLLIQLPEGEGEKAELCGQIIGSFFKKYLNDLLFINTIPLSF